nr:putative pBo3 [Bovine gammaherpesvirus 4]
MGFNPVMLYFHPCNCTPTSLKHGLYKIKSPRNNYINSISKYIKFHTLQEPLFWSEMCTLVPQRGTLALPGVQVPLLYPSWSRGLLSKNDSPRLFKLSPNYMKVKKVTLTPLASIKY